MRAAFALQDQLADVGALPHRTVIEVAAVALGLERRRRAVLGGAMDLLQVAIDLADNLADRAADVVAGRRYLRHYRGIPEATLLCLPALLTGTAVQFVHEEFPEPAFASASAGRRLLRVLGDMAVGQGAASGSARKVALVSGRQGLLLCLPFWLVARRRPWRTRLRTLEAWAYRFGRTWELREVDAEERSAASRQTLARALAEARRAWPRFSPFRPGEALSPALLGPQRVC